MTDDKNTSLIPSGSYGLVRVGNTIDITYKILFGDIEKLFNEAFFLLNSKHLNRGNENYCISLETNLNFRKIKMTTAKTTMECLADANGQYCLTPNSWTTGQCCDITDFTTPEACASQPTETFTG